MMTHISSAKLMPDSQDSDQTTHLEHSPRPSISQSPVPDAVKGVDDSLDNYSPPDMRANEQPIRVNTAIHGTFTIARPVKNWGAFMGAKKTTAFLQSNRKNV
jgi:hypothetical protein